MQVIEEKDEREPPADFDSQCPELTLHAFVRGSTGSSQHRRRIALQRGDLSVPPRGQLAHHAGDGASRFAATQTVQGFEDRQIRPGSCQPLGAGTPTDADDACAVPQFLQPFFDEGRLTDARLSRDAKQYGGAGVGRLESLPESFSLDLPPDGLSAGAIVWLALRQ